MPKNSKTQATTRTAPDCAYCRVLSASLSISLMLKCTSIRRSISVPSASCYATVAMAVALALALVPVVVRLVLFRSVLFCSVLFCTVLYYHVGVVVGAGSGLYVSEFK